MTGLSSWDGAEQASGSVTWVLPKSGTAGILALIGTGVSCFLAQWLTVALWVPPANVSTVWISGGLLLALTLLTDARRWPAVVIVGSVGTSLLFVVLELVPPRAAASLGLKNALLTVAVAYVLRRTLPGPLTLATRREFLTYLLVVVLGGALLAATLLLWVAWAYDIRPATFAFWRTFALAVALGYLSMTPTVVLAAQQGRRIREGSARRRLEAAGLALLLALASALVFSETTDRLATWVAFAVTLPPLLLWAALRFGALGASAALLLVSVVSTATTSRGMGPFAGQSPSDNTLSLQLFILGIGVPLLGLAVVLSEEKRSRDALLSSHARLRELNRRLIAAREEEASRIARELHDDVGQRLALVSLGLARLRQTSAAEPIPAPVPETAPGIVRLQEQTSAIARSLRQISHQLHPAALEHAGLASALELKCEEVRQASGLEVRLVNRCESSAIAQDVALCLYRVTQEALNNVIRHAGARQVEVSLECDAGRLELLVSDDGRGIDPAADPAVGLGLRSAAERVGAVGGQLTIEGTPGGGTRVRVTVPAKRQPEA